MSDLGNKQIMANNIRRYMKNAGVTATDICTVLRIPMPTFSDWINARTYPRIDKIEMLANYFGVSKADLVEAQLPTSEENRKRELIDSAFFRVMQDAQKKGYTPEDLQLALDFLDRARRRDQE